MRNKEFKTTAEEGRESLTVSLLILSCISAVIPGGFSLLILLDWFFTGGTTDIGFGVIVQMWMTPILLLLAAILCKPRIRICAALPAPKDNDPSKL